MVDHHAALVGYVDLLIRHVADGGQVKHLERAIAVGEGILDVDAAPKGWLRYRLELLHALRYHGAGQRAADLELVFHHLRQAAAADLPTVPGPTSHSCSRGRWPSGFG